MTTERNNQLQTLRYRIQVAAAATLAYAFVFVLLTATSPGGMFTDGFAVWEQQIQQTMIAANHQV